MIKRLLQSIVNERMFLGKAILIFGPRQTGKTTLCRAIASEYGESRTLWFNGDEPDIRLLLSDITSTRLKSLFGSKKLIIIDEAQRIENIGLTLKLAVDNFPGIQVIATGPSAFELSNRIQEPMTGRKYQYFLFPVSFDEMRKHSGELEETRLLNHRMVYGYYPEVISRVGEERNTLKLLAESYLYKDLFTYERIKKPYMLEKLIQALALQVGSEVSYQELARTIGLDRETVEKYIDLLEKAFVVFRLPALSRNVRNEIRKGRKVYFLDNGIRNAVINNFKPLELRGDVGHLFENFVISERAKYLHYHNRFANRFFWRTTQQQAIDYIEEYDGRLFAHEIRWNPRKNIRFSQTFTRAYPGSVTRVISRKNLKSFISDPAT